MSFFILLTLHSYNYSGLSNWNETSDVSLTFASNIIGYYSTYYVNMCSDFTYRVGIYMCSRVTVLWKQVFSIERLLRGIILWANYWYRIKSDQNFDKGLADYYDRLWSRMKLWASGSLRMSSAFLPHLKKLFIEAVFNFSWWRVSSWVHKAVRVWWLFLLFYVCLFWVYSCWVLLVSCFPPVVSVKKGYLYIICCCYCKIMVLNCMFWLFIINLKKLIKITTTRKEPVDCFSVCLCFP